MFAIFNIFFVFVLMSIPADDFKSDQKKHSRVKEAYTQKEAKVKSYVKAAGLDYASVQLHIRAFKEERELQIWGKDKNHTKYKLIHTYRFCRLSGKLGPKRKRGDGQVPEGLYYIDRFNPWSNFHLSLGINYPNQSDRKKSPHKDLGGDIFIHGNCVTIGCIPITDDKIKELYILCVEAKNNGQQKIPVHIFPFKMDMELLIAWNSKSETKLINFWMKLKEIYDQFEATKEDISYSINGDGDYVLK